MLAKAAVLSASAAAPLNEAVQAGSARLAQQRDLLATAVVEHSAVLNYLDMSPSDSQPVQVRLPALVLRVA